MHNCVRGGERREETKLTESANVLIVKDDPAFVRTRYRILETQTPGASKFLAGLGLDRKRGNGLTGFRGRAISISVYDTGTVIIDCNDVVMSKLINDYFLTLPFDYGDYASATLGVELPEHWIGTDEAGKGDYFGPLVVAGVCIDQGSASRLFREGLTDSKKVAEERLPVLDKRIRAALPSSSIELIVISPERYNELHSSMGNVLDIMVWAHSKIIRTLSENTGCRVAIVDKFSTGVRAGRMERSVPGVVIHQFTHGEREMGVAAASVIATAQFNRSVERLSDLHGMTFPRGAGSSVKKIALNLRRERGEEFYRKVAKADFNL